MKYLFLALLMTSTSLMAQDYIRYDNQSQVGAGFVITGVFAATGSLVFTDEPKVQKSIAIGSGVTAIVGLIIWGNASKHLRKSRVRVSGNGVSYKF